MYLEVQRKQKLYLLHIYQINNYTHCFKFRNVSSEKCLEKLFEYII